MKKVSTVRTKQSRDIGRVLADLATIGYDAEWDVLPACAFGAPHQRERVFVVGYSVREGLEGLSGYVSNRTGGESA